MKIKTVNKSYDEIMAMPKKAHIKPKKPSFIFRTLARILSVPELVKAKFKHTGKLPPRSSGPFLILMNHSSFIDLKIAQKLLYPRPFGIVCAQDAMVGKAWLMRLLGCIPTTKFVNDLALIHDIKHFIDSGTSVLMYPEAGYSIDGTATALPHNFGSLIKLLKAPVVFIKTDGAFLHQPLYNELISRDVPVSAHISTLFTRAEVEAMSPEQINDRVSQAFSFDNFARQKELGITVSEPLRARGLERVLYKCPACSAEGKMRSDGAALHCDACGKTYAMSELGEMKAFDGRTEFSHIPNWYEWQRGEVRREITEGSYHLEIPVYIGIMNDWRALYTVGEGTLYHTNEGFRLIGCDGKLEYVQKPLSTYTLNADFFWYEIADTISIGTGSMLYYCFPKDNTPVIKARLATEELYILHRDKKIHNLQHNTDKNELKDSE